VKAPQIAPRPASSALLAPIGASTALLALLALLSASAACDQARTIGSRWISDRYVLAAQGAVIELGAADSPELAGAALRLQPGDLAADTSITVEAGTTLLPGEPRPAGPAVLWGPAGLSLARSASMSLPVKLSAGQSLSDLVVVAEGDVGHLSKIDHSQLSIDASGAVVTFFVPRLGTFQAAAVVRCASDHTACPSDEVCRPSGECGPPGPPPPCTTEGCPCPCTLPLVCQHDVCKLVKADGGT
jgi:hypothetical protein